ncbi:hypothetical protein [Paenibacillus azoreducens]|uniref:Uncharacterized protein n=1 Tax=Paenibacillus azoreducens TaxID=116718 RepID=A0A919YHI4_9BACL|nr:hypothetical protein [Paenibacillus azoreducens]GIO49428.1 hypothetical protein J34TS1_41930 [Paenibacillus azoreducens]
MEQLLMEHIPFLQGKVQIEQIHKGYSSEGKYIVLRDDQKSHRAIRPSVLAEEFQGTGFSQTRLTFVGRRECGNVR